jgi:hypothetical protein
VYDATPDVIRADMLGRPDPKFRFRWERMFRENADLPSTTMLVGYALATWMDDDGTNAWPGLRKLKAATALGERAVSKHLAALVSSGWLVRTREGRKVGSGPGAFGVAAAFVASIPAGGTGVHPGTVPGGTDVQAGDSPTGTDVHPGISQGVVSGSQGAPACVPGGTGVHPTEPLYSNQTAAAPLQYHLDAIKFGKNLSGVADDEEAVERHWKANKTLASFPDLLDVVTEHWMRATGRKPEFGGDFEEELA